MEGSPETQLPESADTSTNNNKGSSKSGRCQEWFEQLQEIIKERNGLEEFLDTFGHCSTDEERVRCLYQVPEVHQIIRQAPKLTWKSAEESIELRNQGNKAFQRRENDTALKLYSQSVLKAPWAGDTTALALAFANRSAVLLHMKQYQLCLQDIQFAFKLSYPENLRYKLLERSGKCYQQLQMREPAVKALEGAKASLRSVNMEQEKKKNLLNEFDRQIWQCGKMVNSGAILNFENSNKSHGPLPVIGGSKSTQFPCASEAVSLMVSAKHGRGLQASRNIEAGEILIVEKPFSSVLLPAYNLSHCHHCCNRVISPLPCKVCSNVVYCSEKCQTFSWESYHQVECGVLEWINQADITLGLLALRMVIKNGYPYLLEYKSQSESHCDVNEKPMPGFDESGGYHSDDYDTVYNLVKHSEDRSVQDLFERTFSAIVLLKSVETSRFLPSLKSMGESSRLDELAYVGGHILRHLQMLPCNAHEVSELQLNVRNVPESVVAEVGSGIYAVLSFINHSCDPSVVRHSYGDVCVVRAIRNIAKGEEILDNYGALYPLSTCPERRAKLAKQYYFTCQCLPCQDDWPLYFDIATEIPVFKCEKCCGPVFVPSGGQPENAICSSCTHKQSIAQQMMILAESDSQYRDALQKVLQGNNPDQMLPILEKHLRLMDQFLCRPWRDYNDCQEAMKQCYSVKANCHVLDA